MGILDRLKDQVVSSRIEEEAFYEAALYEIENGGRRPGLWAKALSLSNGNLEEAKARYLQLLVVKLRDETHIAERIRKEQEIAIEEAEQEQKEAERREEIRKNELKATEPAKKQQHRANDNRLWWTVGAAGIVLFIVAIAVNDQTSRSPSVDGANTGDPETRNSIQNENSAGASGSAIDEYNPSQGASEYDRVVSYLLDRYPELNTDHPSFNENINSRAVEARDDYIAQGYGDVDAVLLAVDDIFGDLLETGSGQSNSSGASRTSNPYPECELKGVMTDEDYRRCGLEPPGTR